MPFWDARRVIVTGGNGFLGRHVVAALHRRGCPEANVFVPRSSEYDLTRPEAVRRMYDAFPGDLVIHLAARVGGIGANRANPGSFFHDNLMMGIQLMEEARQRGVAKVVLLGTVCAYPKHTPVPFQESSLWEGYPEETNAPYGLAKKMLLVQSQAYRQQYGFDSIFLLPVNLYGPGDNFDLETSHVIPALIRKMIEASDSSAPRVVCWGDGSPTREFLYVEDCAEGILLAAERYDRSDPVNLGCSQEIAIKDLVAMIADKVGFTGKIVWDASQPNGQPRRMLDSSRAEREFGFRAQISLSDGLDRTIAWFREHAHEYRS